ncbi:conserved hypothetical protein [Vibrio phage 277E43-1]|nr:conserved hypothetical protein [Vibrio phage 277E43-1]
MYTVKVTGQHPIYDNFFSTLYKGVRYDANTKSGKVFFKGVNDRGSYSYEVKSSEIINIIFAAIEKHLSK